MMCVLCIFGVFLHVQMLHQCRKIYNQVYEYFHNFLCIFFRVLFNCFVSFNEFRPTHKIAGKIYKDKRKLEKYV